MDLGTAGFYVLFAVATVSVAIEPGPVQVRLARETALHGRSNGIALNAGTQMANIPSLVLVVLGLNYILSTAAHLLDILRMIGVAYLLWGALSLVRSSAKKTGDTMGTLAVSAELPRRPLWRSFGRGYLMQMMNPLPLGFFAAYLPIWIRPEADISVSLQLTGLAAGLLGIFFLCDLVFVLCVKRVQHVMSGSKWFSRTIKWISASWLGLLAWRLASEKN